MKVSANVGELLADFHMRYKDPTTGESTQHTDFHLSNVLYDVRSDTLSAREVKGRTDLVDLKVIDAVAYIIYIYMQMISVYHLTSMMKDMMSFNLRLKASASSFEFF